MKDKLSFRPTHDDRRNLETVAAALKAERSRDASPWSPAIGFTEAIRAALRVAAGLARETRRLTL